jgi:hypothetical protein
MNERKAGRPRGSNTLQDVLMRDLKLLYEDEEVVPVGRADLLRQIARKEKRAEKIINSLN